MKDLDENQIVYKKYDYPHVLFMGKPGTFKDICIIKDIYDHCRDGVSHFDEFFKHEFQGFYPMKINHVFSNCWLDESYFDGYERITDKEQVDTLRDGILYLYDIEALFNSRGSLTDRQMNELIDIVNNCRKHRVMTKGSCHRSMSVDIKIRKILTLWVEPVPYYMGEEIDRHKDDRIKLNDYVVRLKIADSDLNKLNEIQFDDVYKYANLYNTDEESKKLKL